MRLPVTQSSDTSGTVPLVSVAVVVVVMWPDGGVVGCLRWRMDKTDVVKDEVNAFFLFSSTPASDPARRSELPARRSSLNGAEGHAKLLRAALSAKGVEEMGNG